MLHHAETEAVALRTRQGGFVSIGTGDALATAIEPCFWIMHRFDRGLVKLEAPNRALFMQPTGAVGPTETFFRLRIAQLPIVDIGPMLANDRVADESVVCEQALLDAAQDVGAFFVVGVPNDILREAKTIAEISSRDYALSVHNSRFSKFTLASSTGLVKTSFSPPLHEPIVVPQFLSIPPEILAQYFQQANFVAERILETLLKSLSIGPLEAQFSETYGLLRLICYPPACSAGEYLTTHTDKSWITVLKASFLSGLQFLDADGDSYFDVHDVPDSLLVNIGDALETLSNGQFVSRPHRAANSNRQQCRTSIPLFLEPKTTWPVKGVEHHLAEFHIT